MITRELHKILEPFANDTGSNEWNWQRSIMWSLRRNSIASLGAELLREITMLDSELNTIVARAAKRNNARLNDLPSLDHQALLKEFSILDTSREDQEELELEKEGDAQDAQDAPFSDAQKGHLQQHYFDSLPSEDQLWQQSDNTAPILSFGNLPEEHPWARDIDGESIWSFDTM